MNDNYTIKFGTDGWRAVIADRFTFDNVRRCARGVAGYMQVAGLAERGVVIGYDTRFASADFARVTAEVLAGAGIKVQLDMATDALRVSVEDNGRGFDPESTSDGSNLGLKLIQERTEMLGGTFHIDAAVGKGARIAFTVPLVG